MQVEKHITEETSGLASQKNPPLYLPFHISIIFGKVLKIKK